MGQMAWSWRWANRIHCSLWQMRMLERESGRQVCVSGEMIQGCGGGGSVLSEFEFWSRSLALCERVMVVLCVCREGTLRSACRVVAVTVVVLIILDGMFLFSCRREKCSRFDP